MNFSLQMLAEPIIQYFEQQKINVNQLTLELAGAAGSDRKYFRLAQADLSWVLMVSPVDLDFERFVQISQWLRAKSFPVPEIFAVSAQGQMLLQDLGSMQLLDLVKSGLELEPWYSRVVQGLVQFQSIGDQEILPSIADRVFGIPDLLWETDYFSQYFLGQYLGCSDVERQAHQTFFGDLARRVDAQPKNLMHRDFQSQNLMVLGTDLWWIDYQGARFGSIYYDLGSVLWDPYVGLEQVQVRRFFEAFCSQKQIEVRTAWREFLLASLQRLMQACGAYANLSLNKGKADFSQYLEPGRKRLLEVLELALAEGVGCGGVIDCLGCDQGLRASI